MKNLERGNIVSLEERVKIAAEKRLASNNLGEVLEGAVQLFDDDAANNNISLEDQFLERFRVRQQAA
ncbi:MAG: hypothetical protein WCV88_00630 [Patescibacteria group bacterium]|jgi:hypothetical protein